MKLRRGSNAVEFALSLPMLLMIVIGTIDYGHFLTQRSTIIGAVREGARVGSAAPDGFEIAEAQAAVTEFLAADGVTGLTPNVSEVLLGSGDTYLQVSLSMTYTAPMGFPLIPPPPNIIQKTVTMREEHQ